MFNNTQIKNTAKYLWHLSAIMVQSGALAGILLPNVPIAIVIMTVVLAFGLAFFAVIVDSFVSNDTNPQ